MNREKTKWHLAIPGKMINPGEVCVWRVSLDLPVFQTEKILGNLSMDEVIRAERFHFQRDRNRFIVARGMLRQILGGYLDEKPDKIRFKYSANGKPALAIDSLHFNLSHCGPFALYAITQGRNVGIDMEQIRPGVAIGEIAQRFFTSREVSALQTIHESKRYEVFFQYWTRKEAFLKGIGTGLSFPIEQVDVSSMNGRDLSPVILPGNEKQSPRWYVQDLFPDHDCVAAIAVEEDDWKLSCWQYSV